jgi:formylmethanofuran dehydrogenase subunit D
MAKVVNGSAIVFSQEELDKMGLKKGDTVQVQVQNGCIIINESIKLSGCNPEAKEGGS